MAGSIPPGIILCSCFIKTSLSKLKFRCLNYSLRKTFCRRGVTVSQRPAKASNLQVVRVQIPASAVCCDILTGKEPVLKTGDAFGHWGFESLPQRLCIRKGTQAGLRGPIGKRVGRLFGAGVRIPSFPSVPEAMVAVRIANPYFYGSIPYGDFFYAKKPCKKIRTPFH